MPSKHAYPLASAKGEIVKLLRELSRVATLLACEMEANEQASITKLNQLAKAADISFLAWIHLCSKKWVELSVVCQQLQIKLSLIDDSTPFIPVAHTHYQKRKNEHAHLGRN